MGIGRGVGRIGRVGGNVEIAVKGDGEEKEECDENRECKWHDSRFGGSRSVERKRAEWSIERGK